MSGVKAASRPQHGIKGCYYGGKWVDVEDLESILPACKHNNGKARAAGGNYDATASYPRSRTKHSAVKEDGTYDVVIIGAGCIGASIARELSKFNASVLVLEAADDVTQGATKGNSGIVHAGYDDKPGSVRAKYCWPGNQMFAQLDNELHFGYQKNGSLVVAFNEEEEKELGELMRRGETNGVQNLRIVRQPELSEMEPHLRKDAVSALLAPDAGNIIPYEFTIALMENAADNGVECRVRREVVAISREAPMAPSNGETSPARSTRKGSVKDAKNGLFQVTANYWEPKAYATNGHSDGQSNGAPALAKSSTKADAVRQELNVLNVVAGAVVCAMIAVNYVWTAIMVPHLEDHYRGTPKEAEVAQIVHQIPLHGLMRLWHSQGADMFLAGHVIVALAVIAGTFFTMTSVPQCKQQMAADTAGADPNAGVNKTVGSSDLPVCSVEEMSVGGTGSQSCMGGVLVRQETFRTRYVVNCAGCASDKVAAMIGDTSFKIKPRIGDYLLLNKDQGHLATRTIFPCPHPKLGKGVLVQTTLWGNLILGPTARDFNDPEHMGMSQADVQAYILAKCKELVPELDATHVIHAFAGSRAKSSRGDWIIEPSAVDSGMILVAGIDSPGLAGSPAIAMAVVDMLRQAVKQDGGDARTFTKKSNFNPNRAPLITPKDKFWKGLKVGPIGKYSDPKENVVCKCEKVTEAEVIEACHRSIPVDSTQAIRKRTRAGMGHCQADPGNYDCEHRVASIIARETGLPYEQVGRRPWPGTSTLWSRWMSEDDKLAMVKKADQAAAIAQRIGK